AQYRRRSASPSTRTAAPTIVTRKSPSGISWHRVMWASTVQTVVSAGRARRFCISGLEADRGRSSGRGRGSGVSPGGAEGRGVAGGAGTAYASASVPGVTGQRSRPGLRAGGGDGCAFGGAGGSFGGGSCAVAQG